MSVIRTDLWLEADNGDPVQLCQRLTSYFPQTDAEEICQHLQYHGMYRQYDPASDRFPKLKFAFWRTVQREEKQLKKIWGNIDIPIFILPADAANKKIKFELNGKSGVAFKDKLFLFITQHHSTDELRALFTHEYNHVCRLNHISRHEADFTLLDSVIMEGLAEYAVYNRIGQKQMAKWTTYYGDRILYNIWQQLIVPNRTIPRYHPKHDELLYGSNSYPDMAGYAVGFYVVKHFMEQSDLLWHQCLEIPSEKIGQFDNE